MAMRASGRFFYMFLVPYYRIVLCKLQPQTKSKLDGLWRLGD